MSKVCKECGHQLNDYVEVCPNCGCPIEKEVASASVDNDVLNHGKSTEAESIVTDAAESVKTWINVLAYATLIIGIIAMIAGTAVLADGEGAGIVILGYGIVSISSFLIMKLRANLIWAIIMLFVNMSTTLKRIEIKLEKDGAN